ncbi:MAG: MFS transporter [Candidatus Chloroheliales bacterium]|nr:MAG: MFS transporter [Chloroflexota bacterium]
MFVLGVVSLFTDISSEMIMPVRIIFLVGVLGTPLLLAGLIEGIAESTASIVKIFSGRLADSSLRKPLILFGYGLSNAVKPMLALVSSWPPALVLIFFDRTGKGVRGSPRDAMIADATDAAYQGKAFGFHRAMDTFGAALGPLFAALILALGNQNLRLVFAWTLLPGVLSVLVLIIFLREPRREVKVEKAKASAPTLPFWQRLALLGAPFWMFTLISTLFSLGNSSDAFIFLRTAGLESFLEAVPLAYFGYNIVYALLSTPLGVLSDRFGRIPVLLAGYISFGLVYMGWATAAPGLEPWLLFLLYGVYSAATEGVGKALVSDLIPRGQRGAAMGWFNGLTGFAALPANLLGGWLWASFGPAATFNFGAMVAFAAALLLFLASNRFRKAEAVV